MSRICANEQACVDILELNGKYMASIWLYGMQHKVGPADTCTQLNLDILEKIQDLRLIAGIKQDQNKDLEDLQNCLGNVCNIV